MSYIYKKVWASYIAYPHTQVSHYLSRQDKQCEPTMNMMSICYTIIYTMMPHSKIILNAVFTIAFLTRNAVVQTKNIQIASLGVKSALVNTNQYICFLPILTSGSAVCDCKDNIFLSYILHFILKLSKIKSF